MSAGRFVVTEHWSPCQFVREYPHAVKKEDANLSLAVKEYRPNNDAELSENAVTIIASPGNGFPKVQNQTRFDALSADEFRNVTKRYGTRFSMPQKALKCDLYGSQTMRTKVQAMRGMQSCSATTLLGWIIPEISY